MPNIPTMHGVHKALHPELMVMGIERRLFFMTILIGAVTFNLFYSLLAGVLITLGLYFFFLWMTKRDPQMLRILMTPDKYKKLRYDPLQHEPFHIKVDPPK